MRKVVGKVTEKEKEEIQALFERKNGLTELAKVIGENHSLYERLIKDMGETSFLFQQWWDKMAGKYQWESVDDGNWEIDFNTCEIYLVQN